MIGDIQSSSAESLVFSYLMDEVEKVQLRFASLDLGGVICFFCNRIQSVNQAKNISSFNSLMTSLLTNKGARS